jgi:hypothetical protein
MGSEMIAAWRSFGDCWLVVGCRAFRLACAGGVIF